MALVVVRTFLPDLNRAVHPFPPVGVIGNRRVERLVGRSCVTVYVPEVVNQKRVVEEGEVVIRTCDVVGTDDAVVMAQDAEVRELGHGIESLQLVLGGQIAEPAQIEHAFGEDTGGRVKSP